MVWKPEDVEVLKQTWARGCSGPQIAARLRIHRNAVFAQVRSLGLPPGTVPRDRENNGGEVEGSV